MRLAICRRKPLFTDMGVTLSGGNISMPEKLLHGAKVGTTIEKVGSKGVT
tara:strand:+ start:174 stop:323 length:150 start_codon:yes stop_codon:yes gene_type:complete